ncbi:MAG: Fe-S cluster assembly protein SufD [Bdellovibrionales bacterium]|nr:Fe-S cluster assembly protein SufD [Bdellovibrionales bacterium]
MEKQASPTTNTPPWVRTNFEQFERELNGSAGSTFHELRRKAFDRFVALGLPTTKHEDWKYTNVQSLAKTTFVPSAPGATVELSAVESLSQMLPEAVRVVFVDGRLSASLSSLEGLAAGAQVGSLAAVLAGAEGSEALRQMVEAHLGRIAPFDEESFVALNTAFVHDGAVIRIERGANVEVPILLLFLTSASEKVVSHPRVLIVAEAASSATVVECYAGGTNAYFTSGVSEVFVEQDAVLDHYKLNLEGPSAYHVSTIQVEQEAKSTFATNAFSFGGALVRNEVNPTLKGEGISTVMNGLSVLAGEQHVDNHTIIDHAKPNCESKEWYKGIYADRSHGVFNGTIIVRQDAQKTNAIQSNQSLLLSKDADVDTKPQLKIWADDVRCTHGATIGQLDEDALFYLRSRGIGKDAAYDVLIEAFAADIINEVKPEALRGFLNTLLLEKLRSTRKS